ncbi:MAG: hypothetical protein RL671_240 [Pseudomonadota bacterium]|jgi:hypothetical protein
MKCLMRDALLSIRGRLDRFGVLLSGLCMLHCLAGLLLVAGLGLGGQFLFAPVIHRVGLALAIAVGAVTLVIGVVRHGDPRPMQTGVAGLALMAIALMVGHGLAEALLTIAGVALLAWAHWRNLKLS